VLAPLSLQIQKGDSFIMYPLVNAPATPLPPAPRLRVVTSSVPAPLSTGLPKETSIGTPSCSPLVLHELLKATRQQLPNTYLRAGREFGLTLERTQALIEHQTPVYSAARAIKLARLIAQEPSGGEVFAAAGTAVYLALQPELNGAFRFMVRHLPRNWRVRLTMTVARQLAPHFAGSTNQIILIEPDEQSLYFTLRDGLFTDHPTTLSGAHFYYHRLFGGLLRDFARLEGKLAAVRRPRLLLHQCTLRFSWH
jgi:hypothetical protein